MIKPKVLVGCPTSSHKAYCLKQFAESVKILTYNNYDILLVDNSQNDSYMEEIKALKLPVIKSAYSEFARDRVINARNVLREIALKKDYDYFLSLEQDVIPPRNIIEGLLSHKKDIVSAVVFHLFPKNPDAKLLSDFEERPLIAVKSVSQAGKLAFLRAEQIADINVIVKVDYCPMGCLMLSKEVLEKIRFRYEELSYPTSNPDEVKWDDWCFCEDAQAAGYKIYADLGAKCMHLIVGGYSITLGNTRLNVEPGEVKLSDIMKE